MATIAKVHCPKCGNDYEDKLKQNFAGFYVAKCPKCSEKKLFPLGKIYYSIYWIVIVFFSIGILKNLVKLDFINMLTGSIASWALIIMSAYALLKNKNIKASV